MDNRNIGELVQVLSAGGYLESDELMQLARIGLSRMTGKDEIDIFHLGVLNRDMHAGEPVYSKDFQKPNLVPGPNAEFL